MMDRIMMDRIEEWKAERRLETCLPTPRSGSRKDPSEKSSTTEFLVKEYGGMVIEL